MFLLNGLRQALDLEITLSLLMWNRMVETLFFIIIFVTLITLDIFFYQHHTDEFEDRFQDDNTTAYNLRKNVIDNLLEYACNKENETGCNEAHSSAVDTRGRFINLNDEGGLELVIVLDSSGSVKPKGFQLGKKFHERIG